VNDWTAKVDVALSLCVSFSLFLSQGGYDIAERMFHSVKKDWDSASRDNMSDVRELIPEFYYLPDFLVNTNHFKLGVYCMCVCILMVNMYSEDSCVCLQAVCRTVPL
jgi:hypothetical protein